MVAKISLGNSLYGAIAYNGRKSIKKKAVYLIQTLSSMTDPVKSISVVYSRISNDGCLHPHVLKNL